LSCRDAICGFREPGSRKRFAKNQEGSVLVQLFRKLALATITSGLIVALWAQQPQGQGQSAAQGPQKNWKDRAEYDLAELIRKEASPQKRLELLNQWTQKYAETEFKLERLQYFLITYQALNQFPKVYDTAKEILAIEPRNPQGLFWVMAFTLNNKAPDALDAGEKAANTLVSNLNAIFAPEKKPAEVGEDVWKKQKSDFEALAHSALGWVAYERKNYDQAEKEFVKSLEVNPANGQVSFWAGTVVIAQKNPDKYPQAIWHFARAASYAGPGEFPAANKKQLEGYLSKVYTTYHGDQSGLDEIKAKAATQPIPPGDFKIKTSAEIAHEKEEEFKKTNPMLALWMSVKKELAAAGGEQYFEERVKGAALPGGASGVTKFRGKLISMKPVARPKELVLGIADANTPEVTLKFETPLAGKAEPGIEIGFSGTATAFTKDPFMVTFEVEKEDLEGWVAQPAAPASKKATGGAKKGAVTKKKK
jgi:tetratricopeptide (TPR) repeat protein